MDTRRTEAFSDGVFAVAITVLVFGLLPIGASHDTKVTLAHQLVSGWPQYVAYVTSFLTIGIMWLNHHALIAQLRVVNRPLLIMNLFLLMGVVAVPWPTTLVADHLTGPGVKGGEAATVTYGVVLLAISTAYSAMWVYIGRHAAVVAHQPDRPPERLKTLRFTAGLGGYALAAGVSFYSPGVAMAMYGLIAVYYFFEHLPDPRRRAAKTPAESDS